MNQHSEPKSEGTTRRKVLTTIGGLVTAASATNLRSPSRCSSAEETPQPHSGTDAESNPSLSGIDPKNVVDEYRSRNLDSVSDAEIYRQAAGLISNPQRKSINSFALHAPLELLARYALLPLVDPHERQIARLQIVTSASAYEAGIDAVGEAAGINRFPNLSTARQEFARIFDSGDVDGLDAAMLQVATQFGTSSLVHLLTPLALPTLTGASHSHIGLWLLLRHGTSGSVGDAALLRAAVRRVAAEPQGRLSSFSGMSISGGKPLVQSAAQIEAEILTKLTNPTKGETKRRNLRGLLEAGEKTGNADRLFEDLIGRSLTNEQIDAAFRAVLRVCAHSMLQDEPSQAKFGWSHCLTLPQAACGLSSLNIERKLALAATLVWITAYRSVLSKRALDFSWAPPKADSRLSLLEALATSPTVAASRVWHAPVTERPLIRRTLATQASIRNDQHLVKYTRACFDLCSFDPTHEHLYLAAAAHLCGLWVNERPRDEILNDLLDGRSTS